MNKTCARCEKTVYPTEELKCLDKVWHKGCFKCQECGMTLNMKTYKGYGKLPYCEAHVPKAKHTTMAETPELKRIAENTKIQSNVKYHADFEKSKGKFTQVADDPETLRIKANTRHISNVAYHGDLEKKAHMERQRQINENGEIVEIPPTDNYHHQIENYATEMLPQTAPAPNLPPKNHYQTPQNQQSNQTYQNNQHINPQNQQSNQTYQNNQHINQQQINHQQLNNRQQQVNQQQISHQQHQISHQQQINQQQINQQQINHQQINQQQLAQQQSREYLETTRQYEQQLYRQPTQQKHDETYNYQNYDEYQNQFTCGQYQQPNYGVGGQQKIGRIQDYDPLSDGPRTVPNTQRASATLIYNSTNDAKRTGARQVQPAQQSRQIGRVTDMDPLAEQRPVQHQTQSSTLNHQPTQINQRVYIAMYDYQANDSDEVSFREGDLISNVTSIDDGWMTGQVIRTGHTGMLPANYVEQAPAGSIPGYY